MTIATALAPHRRRALLASLGNVSPEDLAGLREVAELLGVTKRSAQNYARRADFPEPLGRIAAGPVWLRADVERWGREHLPLQTGRPRKER